LDESNGTGTNVKMEDLIFFGSCPSTFMALHVQIVALVSVFVMASAVWSVSFCYSSTHCVPRPQIFVKVGDACPRAFGCE